MKKPKLKIKHLGDIEYTEYISQSESQVNMAVKLLRCHNETVEALSKYRRGGEQKVVVQHVNIDNSNGGKAAIVGAIVSDQKQG